MHLFIWLIGLLVWDRDSLYLMLVLNLSVPQAGLEYVFLLTQPSDLQHQDCSKSLHWKLTFCSNGEHITNFHKGTDINLGVFSSHCFSQ